MLPGGGDRGGRRAIATIKSVVARLAFAGLCVGGATSLAASFPTPPLVEWGATTQQWNLNHHQDPLVQNGQGYWPRLSNGLDTYSDLRFVKGRVTYYTLELYPAVVLSEAENRLLDELPPDAQVVWRHPLPLHGATCEAILARSGVLASKLGDAVLAVARSAQSDFDPTAITSIALSPVGARAGPPKRC
jgi:hypothetical protein